MQTWWIWRKHNRSLYISRLRSSHSSGTHCLQYNRLTFMPVANIEELWRQQNFQISQRKIYLWTFYSTVNVVIKLVSGNQQARQRTILLVAIRSLHILLKSQLYSSVRILIPLRLLATSAPRLLSRRLCRRLRRSSHISSIRGLLSQGVPTTQRIMI